MILLYRNKVRSAKSFARRFNLQNRISLKNLQIQFFLQTPTFNNLQPGFDEAISNCCFDERKHSHKRWCRGQRMRFHFEIRFAEGIFATFSPPPSPFTKFLLTSFVNSASNDLSTSYTSRDKIRSCSSVARSSVAKTIYCIENIERGRRIRSENFSIFAYSFRWSIVIVFLYWWTYDIPRTLHLSSA